MAQFELLKSEVMVLADVPEDTAMKIMALFMSKVCKSREISALLSYSAGTIVKFAVKEAEALDDE